METTSPNTETKNPKIQHRHSKIPDGGYGWIVTIASFMCHFIADGIAFSFGVIYPELVNAFGTSKSATSWIGSLFVGIPLISGPIAGLFVTKYGCRPAAMLGGLITSTGMLLSSFASSIEVLTFTYGVLAGFGLAFIYVPASIIPSFWFEKRRSLATGIAVAGSGLGTFAIAPLSEYLLNEYGWRGTLLVMSGITLNFIVFGALFREVPKDIVHFSGKELEQGYISSVESLQSLSSIPSVRSLHTQPSETSGRCANPPNATTPAPLGSPSRLHHSTNTIHIGEQFDLLQECRPTESINHPQPPVQYTSNPRHHCSIIALMHSKQNLHPVSRHDFTSVMTLALRQRTISSCPDLSSATDEEGSHDGDNNEANADDKTTKNKTARKRSTKRKTNNYTKLVALVRNAVTEMCNVRLLAQPVYLLFFISNFMLSYAYDIPYLYLPDYAKSLHISKPSFLIAISGIVNTFGQVLFGYLGDRKRIDTLLLYGITIMICGVLVTIVPVMQSYLALALFSVLFGLLISANFSLETIVLVKLLSLEQLTQAYGLLMFGQGLASLIGPPIGGLLWDITEKYVHTFLFAGLSIVASGVLAVSIVFVRKTSRSRAISESTDIVGPGANKV